MSKIREIAWPEEFVELKRIEESMVCGICYEYMETTVITPCSHNYCSLCIRKYLHYKSQCPACFHVFFEKDLYINRAMDVLIQHYIKVREKLISLIENRGVYNTVIQQREEVEPSTPPVRPVRNNHFLKSPKVPEIKQSEPKTPNSVKSPKVPEIKQKESKTSNFFNSPKVSEIKQNEPKTPNFPSTSSTLNSDASSPTTHRSSKAIPSIAKIFSTPKRKETVIQPVAAATKSVACPVCRVDISENHINAHLDACLKREVSQKVAKEKQKPKRQPLPKLVLRVMKDAELRKKMKEMGLPTNGDRKALENRFTRYSTIYNAECDKLEPRPVADLIRQCEMEERQERKMDFFLVSSTSASSSNATSTVRLQIEKDAKEEKIEEAQKTYRLANKSNFDKLVEEVRNRRKMEKNKQSDEITASSSNPSSLNDPSNAENDSTTNESSSFHPPAEIPFNDSDSDESCPLQHYKSDGPAQFLSNLNDSSTSVSTSGSPMKRAQTSNVSNRIEKSRLKIKNMSDDIYEASTDESTDEEIQCSPVISREFNRKKVKLSKASPKNSLSTEPQDVAPEINSSIESNAREASARDLCNAIIDDFTFEGMSNDSFSEFSTKPDDSEAKVVDKEQLSKNSSKKVRRPPSRNKSAKGPGETSVLAEEIQRVILGDFSSNSTEDWHDDKSENFSTKIVNTSIVDSNNISEKKVCESIESKDRSQNTGKEKENDVLVANENSQSSTNENTIRRPMRKRNRPSRYAENHTGKLDVDESALNLSNEDSLDNGSPDSCKTVTTASDGSLKRRRGRSKTVVTNLPADESHNLIIAPKRPVRRRQALTGRD